MNCITIGPFSAFRLIAIRGLQGMEKLIKNTLLGEKSQYQKTEVNVAEFYIRVSFKRNVICSN